MASTSHPNRRANHGSLDIWRIWTLSCPCMKAITYTAAREGLASTMDKVCRDRSPVIITRKRNQSVVMLSLADYEQLEETAYLLRSPANARRLLSAIGSLKKGKGRARKIDLAA
jgi:antitoxin YefM